MVEKFEPLERQKAELEEMLYSWRDQALAWKVMYKREHENAQWWCWMFWSALLLAAIFGVFLARR